MDTTRTVAVVDDDPFIRRFIGHVLARAGYRTIEARNAAEARVLIQRQEPLVALLIADIRMPGGSGLDLAVDLETVGPAMPVLYISGLIDSVAVQSILLKNPLAILTKPFTANELAERVNLLIGPSSQSSPPGTNPPTRGRKPMGVGERAVASERMRKYWNSRRERRLA